MPSIDSPTSTVTPQSVPDGRPPQRSPAVAALIAFAIGIVVDSQTNSPFTQWGIVGLAAAGLAVAAVSVNRRYAATMALLVCGLCLGAARHHWFWSIEGTGDIARFADERQAVPVQLTGRLAAAPVIVPPREEAIPTPWKQTERTFCRIDCLSVLTDDGSETVSGTIRLHVSGTLSQADVGDTVEIRGWLRAPSGPKNPGEFDYAAYLRSRGIRAVMYVEEPGAVTVTGTGDWSIAREAAGWRRRCERVLKDHLNSRTYAVGSAMLLGDRSQLTEQTKSAFVNSGMVHILAISGLHVGVLAMFAGFLCRLLNLSQRVTMFAMLAVLLGYLLITDIRPSVVRATVMIAVIILGRPWYRVSGIWNSLAIAALVLLAWRPADLFDAGAQLSFLSVMAIVTSETWWSAWERNRSPFSRLTERGPVSGAVHWSWQWLLRSGLAMTVIWLFTAPLVAARFNVVSPIGMLLNIGMLWAVGIVLCAGFLLLGLGLLFPQSAFLPAAVFDGGLDGLLNIVDWSSSLRWGHIDIAGPQDIWLAGYYGLLAIAVFVGPRLRIQKPAWCAICGWTILGLAGGLAPEPTRGLRCTFLSTGHGVAVLIETPEGKTLLYDAGCLSGGTRATRSVQSALWSRGHTRIDAIVISHADVDHFNGVPRLLETVPVGRVLIAQSFLDWEQSSVVALCDTASAERVPMKILLAEDRIRLGPDISIRVLHPRQSHHEDDNANSIVLEIEYAGRRILLTGDLEGAGLDELLALPPRKADVLLSPHHGSPRANPRRLAQWAQPGYVIACGGRKVKLEVLRKIYGPETTVLSTHGGAVTFDISPDGGLTTKRGNAK